MCGGRSQRLGKGSLPTVRSQRWTWIVFTTRPDPTHNPTHRVSYLFSPNQTHDRRYSSESTRCDTIVLKDSIALPLQQQICVQLRTPADNVVLPAYAAARLLLSAGQPPLSIDIFTGTALSSKPAAAARRERMMRQTHRQTDRLTDRQTDRRTDARQFHRPSFTYYAGYSDKSDFATV